MALGLANIKGRNGVVRDEEARNEKTSHEDWFFLNDGGASRSRTEVHGFAIRCIATLPRRLQ